MVVIGSLPGTLRDRPRADSARSTVDFHGDQQQSASNQCEATILGARWFESPRGCCSACIQVGGAAYLPPRHVLIVVRQLPVPDTPDTARQV